MPDIVTPVFYPDNALRNASIVMTPDGAVSGKGVDRLVDQDIGLECEDSGADGQRFWVADLGIAPEPASVWIFAGSRYAGELLTLESSDDGDEWTLRASITPASDAPQLVAIIEAPVTARYWRWFASYPADPIIFTEVSLTIGYSLRKPSAPRLHEPLIPNVATVESSAGRMFAAQRGSRRWSSTYTMTYTPNMNRAVVFGVLDSIKDGAKPFWLITVTNDLRWVRMNGGIDFSAADLTVDHWDVPLVFVEELP